MMINIAEARTHFSDLIDRAFHGEKIVIAKNNLPLVDLVPHRLSGKRKLGGLAGKCSIPEGFCKEHQEISAMFHGEEK